MVPPALVLEAVEGDGGSSVRGTGLPFQPECAFILKKVKSENIILLNLWTRVVKLKNNEKVKV